MITNLTFMLSTVGVAYDSLIMQHYLWIPNLLNGYAYRLYATILSRIPFELKVSPILQEESFSTKYVTMVCN